MNAYADLPRYRGSAERVRRHNKLAMRHAVSLRGMLALLLAALIAGALLICSTVVQSNDDNDDYGLNADFE